MQEIPLQGHYQAGTLEALQQSPLFGGLQPQDHETILNHGKLFEYEAGEVIVEEGTSSDSFFLLVRGRASVFVVSSAIQQPIEVSQIAAPGVLGEMGLLLRHSRTATVRADGEVLTVRFHHRAFDLMLNSIKGFTIQLCVTLAHRLAQTSRKVPGPTTDQDVLGEVDPQWLRQLPSPFILRHRVLPLNLSKNILQLGFVDEPTSAVMEMVQRILPGIQIHPQRIANAFFTDTLRTHGLVESTADEGAESQDAISITGSHVVVGKLTDTRSSRSSELSSEDLSDLGRILPLLRRMVEEGASDLYLSALEQPRWRIGDQLYCIEDQHKMQPLEPFTLLAALLPEPRLKQFEQQHYVDFSCTISELARFRVHLFRSEKGINAVLRSIPLSPPHPKQLMLPSSLRNITQHNDGLVLFSGPPGSGKTTTISALLEIINHHRNVHVVTLEDPIEYVHDSHKALFHQREIGSHSTSLHQALRDVLRNIPDILVVHDIRDYEALSMLLEIARNRCLVFASMAVRGAVRTVGQLLDLFPSELQEQARLTLGKVLRCVVSQELCERVPKGRIAAFEYLEIDALAASAIRGDDVPALIQLLDEGTCNVSLQMHLAQLVKKGHISTEEAHLHTVDREALSALLHTM